MAAAAPANSAVSRRTTLTSQATPFVPQTRHWIAPPSATPAAFVVQPPAGFINDCSPKSTLIGQSVPEDAPAELCPLEPRLLDDCEADGTQTPPGGGMFGNFFSYIFGSAPDDGTAHIVDSGLDQADRADPLEASVRSVVSLPAKALPVKHTFIHYRFEDMHDWEDEDAEDLSPRPRVLVRTSSAPALLVSVSDASKRTAKTQAHSNGQCKPCAYFHQKEDGCRWGDDCDFCHVCQPGELKKRKREKVKALKAANKSERASRRPSAVGIF
jgi:hypothetical protein